MPNDDIIGIVVSAYDRTMLNNALKDLIQTYPNSVSIVQYLVRNLPFRRIINKQKNKNPQMDVLIIGNTNPNFGSLDDVRFIVNRARNPFSSYGIIDLRIGEDLRMRGDFDKALAETMDEAKIFINNIISEN